jgi:hypothetical protein
LPNARLVTVDNAGQTFLDGAWPNSAIRLK